MLRILPKWYSEVEDELRRQIHILANQNNIQWRFINDSKSIDESIDNIMNVLLRLKEEVRGEFDEETLKQFKKIKESFKKEESKKGHKKKTKKKETNNHKKK